MKKSLVHIYTGGGKGKTTAAVGLAVRARSRNFRVLFAQFFKEKNTKGETDVLKQTGVDVHIFRSVKSPLFNPTIDKNHLKKEAKKALAYLNEIFSENRYDLIILDEFLCMVSEGLISEDEAVKFIRSKPVSLELVLTGRGLTPKIAGEADYLTYMQEIRHPYQKKIKARKGIEF
jgi:cob(I)alamin adenosyltransferase